MVCREGFLTVRCGRESRMWNLLHTQSKAMKALIPWFFAMLTLSGAVGFATPPSIHRANPSSSLLLSPLRTCNGGGGQCLTSIWCEFSPRVVFVLVLWDLKAAKHEVHVHALEGNGLQVVPWQSVSAAVNVSTTSALNPTNYGCLGSHIATEVEAGHRKSLQHESAKNDNARSP